MKYSKEFIKNTLGSFEDFKIDDRLEPNEKPNGNFFVEYGKIKFLVNIPPTEKESANNKTLDAPIAVTMAFPFDNHFGDGIELIDKYRISNQLVDENLSTCTIRYDEKFDSYFITAAYYPMLEQLPEFKNFPEILERKILRYVVLSLSTMCLEYMNKIKEMVRLCKNNKDEFHNRVLRGK